MTERDTSPEAVERIPAPAGGAIIPATIAGLSPTEARDRLRAFAAENAALRAALEAAQEAMPPAPNVLGRALAQRREKRELAALRAEVERLRGLLRNLTEAHDANKPIEDIDAALQPARAALTAPAPRRTPQ